MVPRLFSVLCGPWNHGEYFTVGLWSHTEQLLIVCTPQFGSWWYSGMAEVELRGQWCPTTTLHLHKG